LGHVAVGQVEKPPCREKVSHWLHCLLWEQPGWQISLGTILHCWLVTFLQSDSGTPRQNFTALCRLQSTLLRMYWRGTVLFSHL